jgi:hypothetical protein
MNELAIFVIGVVVGLGLMMLYIAYRFKTILNSLDQYIDGAIDSTLLGMRVEKHDDVYRFYRSKDDQFVLQTTTLANLREEFKQRFPTKTCFIDGGDEAAVAAVKEALKNDQLV